MNVELEAIIKNAIAQGESSYKFYLQMANLVTLKETKETFEFLAKVELEHNHFLQSAMMPQGCDPAGQAQNVDLAGKAPENSEAPTNLKPDLENMVHDEGNVAWIEDESLKLLGMLESSVGATLHSGGTFIDEVGSLSPTESLLIALKREEGSYRLYQTLAARQPPGKPRAVLEKISQMKLGLKEKIEYLYNNAAFVEVW